MRTKDKTIHILKKKDLNLYKTYNYIKHQKNISDMFTKKTI